LPSVASRARIQSQQRACVTEEITSPRTVAIAPAFRDLARIAGVDRLEQEFTPDDRQHPRRRNRRPSGSRGAADVHVLDDGGVDLATSEVSRHGRISCSFIRA
jgi:hypothetical protein